MTTTRDLGRRLADHFAGEAPRRSPDWILPSALTTIESTPQRRGLLAPWRFNTMPSSMKLAAGGLAAIAVIALAVWQLAPKTPGPGGPSVQPSPSVMHTPDTTAASPEVIPPLSGSFTSDVHGMSVSYPEGWETDAAIDPWTAGADLPWDQESPQTDFVLSPGGGAIFLGLASQSLGDESSSEWIDRMLAIADPEPCSESDAVTVDGAEGRIATCDEPLRAFVTDAERGYAIFLYRSDEADKDLYGVDFFNRLLETVQLLPADAVAAARTAG
jgi:hypothetical protein